MDTGGYRKGLFPSEFLAPTLSPVQTQRQPSVPDVLFGIITLGRFRLDHDRGVAALIEFGLVRDGTNDIAGVEADGRSQRR